MSLQTPVKIRTFQRKLYLKAKAEPDYRFYLLYDKIYREDVVLHAYRLAKANGGSAGVDGMTFKYVESEGVDELKALLNEYAKGAKPSLYFTEYMPFILHDAKNAEMVYDGDEDTGQPGEKPVLPKEK